MVNIFLNIRIFHLNILLGNLKLSFPNPCHYLVPGILIVPASTPSLASPTSPYLPTSIPAARPSLPLPPCAPPCPYLASSPRQYTCTVHSGSLGTNWDNCSYNCIITMQQNHRHYHTKGETKPSLALVIVLSGRRDNNKQL